MSYQNINLNTAVFTTKFVVKEGSEIVYVSHDSDGDWQFFGSETDTEIENAMVVALKDIIHIDESVKEVLMMPKFSEAHRKNKNSKWEIIYRQ